MQYNYNYQRNYNERKFLTFIIWQTLLGAAKRNLNSLALQFSRRKQADGSHHKLLEQDDTEVSGEEQVLFIREDPKGSNQIEKE